jgi:hypothetical protein
LAEKESLFRDERPDADPVKQIQTWVCILKKEEITYVTEASRLRYYLPFVCRRTLDAAGVL